MKSFFKVSLFFSLILLYGCTKSHSLEDLGNGKSPSEKTALSKFILIDTSRTAPNDTVEIIYFKYDDQSRIVAMNDINYNWTGHPDTTTFNSQYWEESTYYYKGADTLPYMRLIKNVDNLGLTRIMTDTSYRDYDAKGRLVKDSSINFSIISGGIYKTYRDMVVKYSYPYPLLVRTIKLFSSPYTTHTDSLQQTIVDGNVVYQKDPRPVSTKYTLWPTCHFTFDSHPNPMYRNGFCVEPAYSFYNFFGIGIKYENQKNNYLMVSKHLPVPTGSSDFEFLYDYTYRSDGYPATVFLTLKDGSGSPFGFKGIYIYP